MAFQGLRRGLVNMNSADPKLTNLLHEEKDVLKELANLAREKAEAARFLTMWGNIEHADIKDICDRTRDLLNEFQNMLSDFSAGYGNYREKLKEIHKGGETLHDLKHKQSTLQSKLSQAIKNKKPHEQLQSELATTEREVLEHIANYESSKRALFRDALESQFEAFNVFGKQLVVLGTFGKYMAGQIPQGKLAPGQDLPMYKGNDTTRQIYSDFIKELKEVRTRHPALKRSNTSSSIPEITRLPSQATPALDVPAKGSGRGSQADISTSTASRTPSPLPPPPANTQFQTMSATQRMGSLSLEGRSSLGPAGVSASGEQLHWAGEYVQQPLPSAPYGPTTPSPPQHSHSHLHQGAYVYATGTSATPPQAGYSQAQPAGSHLYHYNADSSGYGAFAGSGRLSVSPMLPPQASITPTAPLSLPGGIPQFDGPMSGQPQFVGSPAAMIGERCPTCGRGIASGRMGDHRASGCLTHVVTL